ncbi:MAG: DUF624 domain-containing protein [Oscillibacter sp.]|nr:DUF624 domain-containing protein [Oscillibacter sp.]
MSIWGGNRNWRSRHGEPRNRRELFLCVLYDQFFSLIFLNFFYTLFYLPAIAWTVVCGAGIASSVSGGDAATAAGQVNTLLLGLVPCLTLTGPVRAGMAKVHRNWAREETTPPYSTFWAGARDNWRSSLVPAFISALFPLILWNAYRFSAQNAHAGAYPVLLALASIAALLWAFSQEVLYTFLVTYDLPLRAQLRNALLLTVMRLPQAFAIRLASLFGLGIYLLFVWIRPEMVFSLLVIPVLYYLFIGWCMRDLIFAAYANDLCDRYFPNGEE